MMKNKYNISSELILKHTTHVAQLIPFSNKIGQNKL